MSKPFTGAEALALGAAEAGVSLVTGYPGAPATAVVNKIMELTSPEMVQVEWTGNEKVAIEMAFGASVAGMRSLLCVKSVGLNIALDPLMVFNLSGCNAGFAILVGDDPGGWGSQNEQDSRALGMAAQLPMIEPLSVTDARKAVRKAFQISEDLALPVLVRFTSALAAAGDNTHAIADMNGDPLSSSMRPFQRYVVLPIDVVPFHLRLHQRLDAFRARMEESSLNREEGEGTYGIIASGFIYQKLMDLIGGKIPESLRVFGLGTFYPLPHERIMRFLKAVKSALVLEETYPLTERAVKSLAQQDGVTVPVCGRDTGHVSSAGELLGHHIAASLNAFLPSLDIQAKGDRSRSMPSRVSLCDGCPYVPTFDALLDVMIGKGGREKFIIVGEPGCMVRSQLPPYELLDVKTSLGSSIGMAAGISLSLPNRKNVIALCGDSSFLHSDLNALMDAVRIGATMLVLILDNGTTALSGGQPHPASPTDARGRPRKAVDLATLARSAGADFVKVTDLDQAGDIHSAIAAGVDFKGVAVVIARGLCPRSVPRSKP
jgi:indolepyruvate ferredoxin oxidoreductase alpha subunit